MPDYEHPDKVLGYYMYRVNDRTTSTVEYWVVYRNGRVSVVRSTVHFGRKGPGLPRVAGTMVESGGKDQGYPMGITLEEFLQGKQSDWSRAMCSNDQFRKVRSAVQKRLKEAVKERRRRA